MNLILENHSRIHDLLWPPFVGDFYPLVPGLGFSVMGVWLQMLPHRNNIIRTGQLISSIYKIQTSQYFQKLLGKTFYGYDYNQNPGEHLRKPLWPVWKTPEYGLTHPTILHPPSLSLKSSEVQQRWSCGQRASTDSVQRGQGVMRPLCPQASHADLLAMVSSPLRTFYHLSVRCSVPRSPRGSRGGHLSGGMMGWAATLHVQLWPQ